MFRGHREKTRQKYRTESLFSTSSSQPLHAARMIGSGRANASCFGRRFGARAVAILIYCALDAPPQRASEKVVQIKASLPRRILETNFMIS
jgi:hypothetical protein